MKARIADEALCRNQAQWSQNEEENESKERYPGGLSSNGPAIEHKRNSRGRASDGEVAESGNRISQSEAPFREGLAEENQYA